MELDEGDLAAAALYTAQANMFAFMLSALKVALENERRGGYTADGRQLEPPTAHLVRPVLERFLAEHSTVGDGVPMTTDQAARANELYWEHIAELKQEVLEVVYPYEI